jgi:eukaryotic-like serine/threonine-protein kinase
MPDDLHPGLLPTVDLPQNVEEPSTNDATRSASTFGGRDHSPIHDSLAPSIPGYAITGELARGGMGVVYAGKELKLNREVAIKTLLPGADATRFLTESEITARLPHPGIPSVYALGELDDGSPYLAMKLIRGRTLAELLKGRASPSDDVSRFIAIFEQIAQAVGFAHEQGIIHRDLKPLNVMVGAFGEVQVMDWGLAKDLSVSREATPSAPADADDLALTSFGAVMGTPGYMAPEQARGEPADARADVFALGAILAAILTGKPAFVGTTAGETIEKAARGDLSETLERLAASGADAELIAVANESLALEPKNRPTEARQVAERIGEYRRGVDARLKQAEMAKAEALVREAEGHKRRRAMQWASGIIAAVLLVGIVGTSLGMREARRQEGFARYEAGEKGKALWESEANLKQAKTNLAFAKKGNAILGSVFEGLKPKKIAESGRPLQDILREKLDKAVQELDGSAIGDRQTMADMQMSLGESLLGLGDPKYALVLFERANALLGEVSEPNERAKAVCSNLTAEAHRALGRTAKSLPYYEKALGLLAPKFGRAAPPVLGITNNLALAYSEVGMGAKATRLLEETVDLLAAALGPDHTETLTCMTNLASCYLEAGQHDKAIQLDQKSFDRRLTKLGAEHPDTLVSMNNLALVLLRSRRLIEARPLFEKALATSRKTMGATHPDTIIRMGNLAVFLVETGESDKALPYFDECAKLWSMKFGAVHPSALTAANNLAMCRNGLKQFEAALPLLEETLRLRRESLGRDHPDALLSLKNFATCLRDSGRPAQAMPLFEEVLEKCKKNLGTAHPDTISAYSSFAACLQKFGDLKAALPLFEECLKLTKAARPNDAREVTIGMIDLARCLDASGRKSEAESLFKEAISIRREKFGSDHRDTLGAMVVLGAHYDATGQGAKAIPFLEEVLAARKRVLGVDHRETIQCTDDLAKVYSNSGRVADALPLVESTVKWRKANQGATHTATIGSMESLAASYWLNRRHSDAATVFEELVGILETTAGREHVKTIDVLYNLGRIYAESGRGKSASIVFERYVDAKRKHSPNDPAGFSDRLARTGFYLLSLGEFAVAARQLEECLTLREKNAPNSWTTFNTQSLLGAALLGQNKYAEAEPLLLKGYEGMKAREKTIPPAGKTRIPEAIDRLVELYTATNKPDEVKKWKAERAKYPAEQKQAAVKK